MSLNEPTAGPKAPNDEQMAAIIVAVEQMWPQPSVEEDVAHTADAVWKFANRWWQGSNVVQRGRPRRPSTYS